MHYTWLEIISILFVIDSLGALWFAWYGKRWYMHHMGVMAKYLPPAKGWAVWYFLLACFIFALIQGWLS